MFRMIVILVFVLVTTSGQYVTQSSPPRFKQNVRRHQYTYLGDTAKFNCNSLGRPMPKVHWYRNGVYLNYSFMQERPRIQEKGMDLEIRRVEVGDKGQWACRVWNSESSIVRNFTLHIIDFCDFYLTSEARATSAVTSEACLCEWLSTEDPDFEEDDELLDFRDKFCSKHEKENQVTKFRTSAQLSPCKSPSCEDEDMDRLFRSFRRRNDPTEESSDLSLSTASHFAAPNTPLGKRSDFLADPIALFDELVRTGVPDVTHLFPGLITITEMNFLRYQLRDRWNLNLDTEEKLQRARSILKERIPVLRREHEQGLDVDDTNGYGGRLQADSGLGELIARTPEPQALASTTAAAVSDLRLGETPTTRHWNPIGTTRTWKTPTAPTRVAPYFRQTNEQTTIVVPSGRTLRLNCKSGGLPEPQVVWRKDHAEIDSDSERKSGSTYRVRKWTLELEDAAEGDTGHYTCDVFNNVGAIHRDFRVDVRDRIRARPIILPNVFTNRTVDVNGTVNFTCQVLSDLVPHVVWIHLIRLNGSYIRWDERQNRNVFNFVDMSSVKKAHIFHDNQSKQYSLTITNVSVEDQGIYSCVAGNTLGISMANASLTVNEFRGMTLPTDNPYPPWPLIYTIFLVLLLMSLVSFLTLGLMYYLFSRRANKGGGLLGLEEKTVRKKVIITKKQKPSDVWSDLASSYTITVEPIAALGKVQSRNRTRVNSEMSLGSEYEVPTDVAWEIDRTRLTLIDIIGEGAFGEVWRGELRPRGAVEPKGDEESRPLNDNKVSVAVKKLKSTAQEKELIILVSEMQIFKSIGRHKNILRLVGCCTGTGSLLVVLELCPHGNLRDFLRLHRPHGAEPDDEDSQQNYAPSTRKSTVASRIRPIQNLTLRDLIRFATEVSCGMEFLSSKKIIHRDLAARNVLVAQDLSAKISDFGLSRNVFCKDYYRKRGAGRLPIKWMAPEALEANVYTVYSDVWSFGITCWEIMTLGGTPYPTIAMPQLYNLLKEGYRMEAPHNCPDEIYGVMVMCWQEKPESRPQFQTICDYLEWIVQEAMRMNTAGIDDNYMETELGVETTLNEDDPKRRLTRPLSAPGLMSIQSFARGLTSLGVDAVDKRLHESTPLLATYAVHPPSDQAKSRNVSRSGAKGSGDWQTLRDSTTGETAKPKRSTDRSAATHQSTSQIIYTTPLFNTASSASNSEHNANSSLSNTETEYHENVIPYVNVHEYVNHQRQSNGDESGPSNFKAMRTTKAVGRSSLNMPKLSASSTDSHMYEVIGNGHSTPEAEETEPQKPRSQSVDSQTSSGHGGSSAMSSAEGLGGIGELCRIESPRVDKAGNSADTKTP